MNEEEKKEREKMDWNMAMAEIKSKDYTGQQADKSFKVDLTDKEREVLSRIERDFAEKEVEVEEDFFTYTCYLYLKRNEEEFFITESKRS